MFFGTDEPQYGLTTGNAFQSLPFWCDTYNLVIELTYWYVLTYLLSFFFSFAELGLEVRLYSFSLSAIPFL
jgi:hypothetical protein